MTDLVLVHDHPLDTTTLRYVQISNISCFHIFTLL